MTADSGFQGFSRGAIKKKPARSAPLLRMFDLTSFSMVMVKIDRNAKYGLVPPLLAEIRSAGVENICFLVENYPHARTGRAANKIPANGPM